MVKLTVTNNIWAQLNVKDGNNPTIILDVGGTYSTNSDTLQVNTFDVFYPYHDDNDFVYNVHFGIPSSGFPANYYEIVDDVVNYNVVVNTDGSDYEYYLNGYSYPEATYYNSPDSLPSPYTEVDPDSDGKNNNRDNDDPVSTTSSSSSTWLIILIIVLFVIIVVALVVLVSKKNQTDLK